MLIAGPFSYSSRCLLSVGETPGLVLPTPKSTAPPPGRSQLAGSGAADMAGSGEDVAGSGASDSYQLTLVCPQCSYIFFKIRGFHRLIWTYRFSRSFQTGFGIWGSYPTWTHQAGPPTAPAVLLHPGTSLQNRCPHYPTSRCGLLSAGHVQAHPCPHLALSGSHACGRPH